MPRASVTIAAAVKPGLERSWRKAQVRLWRNMAVFRHVGRRETLWIVKGLGGGGCAVLGRSGQLLPVPVTSTAASTAIGFTAPSARPDGIDLAAALGLRLK